MSRSSVCQGSECGDFPQVCVDWCDASAFCRAVGKRLCGKIDGGPNAPDDAADPSRSQWFDACSSSGAYDYPPGDILRWACNGIHDEVATFAAPVASFQDCRTPGDDAGVYDLSGNVWEWEDSCTGPDASGQCLRRGGSFACGIEYLRCDYRYEGARDEVDEDVGFRCCAP